MKILTTICRILVGSLFIVSGLIKVNDVIGFGYKLEEYFAESALNFPGLEPFIIPIAIFIVVGEVLLGVALLLGAWPKLTTSLILFMTVFFLWLTNYTASCIDRREAFKPTTETPEFTDTCVETCGCFGDAIPLEPRESFYKDVVLLIFVIPVFFAAWRGKFKLNTWKEDAIILSASVVVVAGFSIKMLDWMFPIYFTIIAYGLALLVKKFLGEKVWLMALVVLGVTSYLQCYTYQHLPLKDYRAYAIGNNILEKTKSAEELGLDPPKYVSMYTLKNLSTGEVKEIDSDAYLAQRVWEDKNWEIQKDKTYKKKISDGYEPKIKDFNPTNQDGDEVREQLLTEPRVFLMISKMPEEMETKYLPQIAEFSKAAQADGAKFYAITPAGGESVEQLRFQHQLPFDFLINDMTELKIIIRDNPGIVYLENGVVVNMWADNDLPAYNEAKQNNFRP
jgi:uncharacterized membrane protein YphA (DoxX/SURF4 family)